MFATTFFLLLVQGLIQYPQQAGDGLDEATAERMRQRAEYLNQQMAQLIQEMEQKNLEQSAGAWGALFLWQSWALAGILVLLLVLWFGLGKIRRHPDHSGHKERSSSNLVQEEVPAEAEGQCCCKERNSNDANVEEDHKDGNEESSNVSAKAENNAGKEAKEDNDDQKEEGNHGEEGQEANAARNEQEVEKEEEEEGHKVLAKKEIESDDAGVEEEHKDRNEEGSNVEEKAESNAETEAKEDSEDQKEEGNHGEEGQEANAARNEQEVEEKEEGRKALAKKEIESDDAVVEEERKDGNEEGSNAEAKVESIAGNKAKGGNDDAKEEVNHGEKGEETNAARNEEDKHDANEADDDQSIKGNLGSLLEERIQLPVLDLDKGCSLIMDLMDKLTQDFGQDFSNSFYPVPQQAIGVGSTFEGWSPHAQDVVYRVLVPLSPPPGHAFHLELDTAGTVRRNFRVRVELLCTCMREQLREGMLCFLHHPEEELIRKQDPSLLQTLCTGSYLDVEKTVHWFYRFVRASWLFLPQSRHWHLMLQPCSRSCKFQISRDKESFTVEMVFGVRQGDTDIFVGSQPTGAGIPSTTWPETYAVAEAKFFTHISRQAPQDSWHCKCLQFLTRFMMGTGFSSYALKTVVMHLLNTVPPTRWRRRDFQQRLMDILKYLHCSLQTKRLPHFVIGNERFPTEISLPSGFRVAEPPNLFQPLASSPDAHKKALQEYVRLLHRLKQLLMYGH